MNGRVALVTGGGRGIGRVAAQLLAAAGARVMVVSRSAAELATLGLEYVVADLGTAEGCARAVAETERRLGPIDVLVVNHGIGSAHERLVWEQDPEVWHETMRINLDGPFELARLTVGGMCKRGYGRLVFTSSTAGEKAERSGSAYSASKHGVIGLARAIAQDAGPFGVTSNAVLPGWVRTAMAERSARAETEEPCPGSARSCGGDSVPVQRRCRGRQWRGDHRGSRRHVVGNRLSAALPLAWLVACGMAQPDAAQAAPPAEYPTRWEVPPGDPVELETAGFAKLLCSVLFITGRSLMAAIEEDGSFVKPPQARSAAHAAKVDWEARSVSLTLPNGVTRSAREFADQGCVILPRGRSDVFFTPKRLDSTLPDPATQPWPMGDLLPMAPLPAEIDTANLAQAVDAAFDPPEALTAAFVVAWRGRIIAERYANGVDHTTRLPSWSMGKSLTATLIGQLVLDGTYDLWKPAPIAEWQGEDDPRRAIRIADLMRMSGGLRFVSSSDPDYDPARGYADHDYIYTGAIDTFRWAVTRPPQWPAGTVGRYRNSDPLVLNYLIKQAAIARGEDYLSWPQRHLFDRLGMRRMVLETDPYGNFVLTGYDLGSARDWLRLGMLYLQDGVWNGERLLPEGWVDFVRTPAPAWDEPEYGGLFWLNRTGAWPVPEDAFYMSGAGGQTTIIIPTHDLVVVRLGHYRGEEHASKALARALEQLLGAVPQARSAWNVPARP